MQLVTLLFRNEIQPDFFAIKERVAELLNESIRSSPVEEVKSSFLLFYLDHEIDYSDKSTPAQTAFMLPDTNDETDYSEYVQQSWSFPEAGNVLEKASYHFTITEFMTRVLEPQLRLKLFHAALQATVEICKPIALVFHHSEQIVCPSTYLASCSEQPELRQGSINIRFFNLSESNGDMIMDSRGLDEIGLSDLQCHFKKLDPNDVARVLFNTAVYLVENGNVIESGQTIAGQEPDEMWECQYEKSLLKPTREILDVNPGIAYAAGNRNV